MLKGSSISLDPQHLSPHQTDQLSSLIGQNRKVFSKDLSEIRIETFVTFVQLLAYRCRPEFSGPGFVQGEALSYITCRSRTFGRRSPGRRSLCERKFDFIDTIIISSIPLKLNVMHPLMKMLRLSLK